MRISRAVRALRLTVEVGGFTGNKQTNVQTRVDDCITQSFGFDSFLESVCNDIVIIGIIYLLTKNSCFEANLNGGLFHFHLFG